MACVHLEPGVSFVTRGARFTLLDCLDGVADVEIQIGNEAALDVQVFIGQRLELISQGNVIKVTLLMTRDGKAKFRCSRRKLRLLN